jgi:hypothetical protein
VAVISYDEKPGIQAIAVGAGNCQIEEERLARRLLALHEIDVTNSSLLEVAAEAAFAAWGCEVTVVT